MINVTHKNKITLPVLKSWTRIFDLLETINSHGHDREGFQQAVLDLYGNEKTSKSVFRGMAIPTLRNLGFILGYGSVIRISANGSLIFSAYTKDTHEGFRALRTILVEMEKTNNFGILDYLIDKPSINYDTLISYFIGKIETSEIRRSSSPKAKEKAAKERLSNWINFLVFSQIIFKDRDNIRIDTENYYRAMVDINHNIQEKKENFKSILLKSYKKIVHSQTGLGTVEIEALREATALSFYSKYNLLVTEKQFDALLSSMPKTTDDYVITLGRSMGADEKLFVYQGKYYQTIFVRDLTSSRGEK